MIKAHEFIYGIFALLLISVFTTHVIPITEKKRKEKSGKTESRPTEKGL